MAVTTNPLSTSTSTTVIPSSGITQAQALVGGVGTLQSTSINTAYQEQQKAKQLAEQKSEQKSEEQIRQQAIDQAYQEAIQDTQNKINTFQQKISNINQSIADYQRELQQATGSDYRRDIKKSISKLSDIAKGYQQQIQGYQAGLTGSKEEIAGKYQSGYIDQLAEFYKEREQAVQSEYAKKAAEAPKRAAYSGGVPASTVTLKTVAPVVERLGQFKVVSGVGIIPPARTNIPIQQITTPVDNVLVRDLGLKSTLPDKRTPLSTIITPPDNVLVRDLGLRSTLPEKKTKIRIPSLISLSPAAEVQKGTLLVASAGGSYLFDKGKEFVEGLGDYKAPNLLLKSNLKKVTTTDEKVPFLSDLTKSVKDIEIPTPKINAGEIASNLLGSEYKPDNKLLKNIIPERSRLDKSISRAAKDFGSKVDSFTIKSIETSGKALGSAVAAVGEASLPFVTAGPGGTIKVKDIISPGIKPREDAEKIKDIVRRQNELRDQELKNIREINKNFQSISETKSLDKANKLVEEYERNPDPNILEEYRQVVNSFDYQNDLRKLTAQKSLASDYKNSLARLKGSAGYELVEKNDGTYELKNIWVSDEMLEEIGDLKQTTKEPLSKFYNRKLLKGIEELAEAAQTAVPGSVVPYVDPKTAGKIVSFVADIGTYAIPGVGQAKLLAPFGEKFLTGELPQYAEENPIEAAAAGAYVVGKVGASTYNFFKKPSEVIKITKGVPPKDDILKIQEVQMTPTGGKFNVIVNAERRGDVYVKLTPYQKYFYNQQYLAEVNGVPQILLTPKYNLNLGNRIIEGTQKIQQYIIKSTAPIDVSASGLQKAEFLRGRVGSSGSLKDLKNVQKISGISFGRDVDTSLFEKLPNKVKKLIEEAKAGNLYKPIRITTPTESVNLDALNKLISFQKAGGEKTVASFGYGSFVKTPVSLAELDRAALELPPKAAKEYYKIRPLIKELAEEQLAKGKQVVDLKAYFTDKFKPQIFIKTEKPTTSVSGSYLKRLGELAEGSEVYGGYSNVRVLGTRKIMKVREVSVIKGFGPPEFEKTPEPTFFGKLDSSPSKIKIKIFGSPEVVQKTLAQNLELSSVVSKIPQVKTIVNLEPPVTNQAFSLIGSVTALKSDQKQEAPTVATASLTPKQAPKVLDIQITKDIVKETPILDISSKSASQSKTETSLIQAPSVVETPIEIPKTITIPKETESVAQSQTQSQRLSQDLRQSLVIKSPTVSDFYFNVPKIKTPTPKTPNEIVSLPLIEFDAKYYQRKKKRKLLPKGYKVLVKKKGKFVATGTTKFSLPKVEAEALAVRELLKGPEATAKIIPSMAPVRSRGIKVSPGLKAYFRPGRKAGTIVQRERFRIITPGEKRGVTFKGAAAKKARPTGKPYRKKRRKYKLT